MARANGDLSQSDLGGARRARGIHSRARVEPPPRHRRINANRRLGAPFSRRASIFGQLGWRPLLPCAVPFPVVGALQSRGQGWFGARPVRLPGLRKRPSHICFFLSDVSWLNARRSQCLESRDGLCARSRYGSQVFQGVSCPRALRAMLRAVRARVNCLCWVHYSARAYLGFHALCFPARDFGVRRLQACRAWPGVARRRLGRRLQDRRSRMLYAAGSCRR
jgi:hypothetical protein